jgi:signal transduction histidine kinase
MSWPLRGAATGAILASKPVEVAAFDIVMEAVSNVAKYARARRCTVPVSSRFDQISALLP